MSLYKIGELAERVNVSKRTIDYYTQIGLLQVEKTSTSNYRLYSDKTIQDIRFIELCKELNMSLQEIKERMEIRRYKSLSEDEQDKCIKFAKLLAAHMKNLEVEIQELKPLFEQLNKDSQAKVTQQISSQSKSLIESLSLIMK